MFSVTGVNSVCGPQFHCNRSPIKKCISMSWVCDGDADCPHGEDELQNCSKYCRVSPSLGEYGVLVSFCYHLSQSVHQ